MIFRLPTDNRTTMSPALHRRLRRDNETDTQPTGAEADTRPSSFHAENITVSCAQLGRLAGQAQPRVVCPSVEQFVRKSSINSHCFVVQ